MNESVRQSAAGSALFMWYILAKNGGWSFRRDISFHKNWNKYIPVHVRKKKIRSSVYSFFILYGKFSKAASETWKNELSLFVYYSVRMCQGDPIAQQKLILCFEHNDWDDESSLSGIFLEAVLKTKKFASSTGVFHKSYWMFKCCLPKTVTSRSKDCVVGQVD